MVRPICQTNYTYGHRSAQVHCQPLQEGFLHVIFIAGNSFEVLGHWVRCLLLLVRQNNIITQHSVVCCAINNMAAEENQSSELIQLAEPMDY